MTRKAVILVFAVALALPVTVWTLRVPVLEGRLLQQLRGYYLLLLPLPTDFYTALAEFPVDLAQAAQRYRFTVSHRYVGNYALGLRVGKEIPQPVDSYDWGSRLVFGCESPDGMTYRRRVGDDPSPWWTNQSQGFLLHWYRVPRDLPRGQTLSCLIEVAEGSRRFDALYGSGVIVVRKMSDL
jgi:hypothetical protein